MNATLKIDIACGATLHPAGELVKATRIHAGTWDECFFVIFENGQTTYLSTGRVQLLAAQPPPPPDPGGQSGEETA